MIGLLGLLWPYLVLVGLVGFGWREILLARRHLAAQDRLRAEQSALLRDADPYAAFAALEVELAPPSTTEAGSPARSWPASARRGIQGQDHGRSRCTR